MGQKPATIQLGEEPTSTTATKFKPDPATLKLGNSDLYCACSEAQLQQCTSTKNLERTANAKGSHISKLISTFTNNLELLEVQQAWCLRYNSVVSMGIQHGGDMYAYLLHQLLRFVALH